MKRINILSYQTLLFVYYGFSALKTFLYTFFFQNPILDNNWYWWSQTFSVLRISWTVKSSTWWLNKVVVDLLPMWVVCNIDYMHLSQTERNLRLCEFTLYSKAPKPAAQRKSLVTLESLHYCTALQQGPCYSVLYYCTMHTHSAPQLCQCSGVISGTSKRWLSGN